MTISWMRALETQGVTSPAWVPGPQKLALAQMPSEREQQLAAREQALQTQMRDVEALRQRYEGGIKALENVKTEIVARAKTEATEIAFAVGRELAQRELASTALPEMVSSLLSDLNEEKPTVRMAPKDAERFRAQLSSVELIADDSLESGSAIVVGKEATIDASFRARTQRIREALGLQPLKLARGA
jgi:flagellar biosynthesis/type III secretory pathway protein FliH